MTENPFFQVGTDPELTVPEFDNEEYAYVGYFENKAGDHLVFAYDADVEEAYLYNTKEGWEERTVISREELLQGDFHLHFAQFEGEEKWLHSVVLGIQPRFKAGEL